MDDVSMRVTEVTVSALPDGHRELDTWSVRVAWRGDESYAVTWFGGQRVHKGCSCVRRPGHDGPCNCIKPDVPADGDLAEQGRQLASQREDLIAAGVDPGALEIPLAPTGAPVDGELRERLAEVLQDAHFVRDELNKRDCPSGCGCRYMTNDPDRMDCGCDGPCCMDEDWWDGRDYDEAIADALLPFIAAHVAERERAAAEQAWDEGWNANADYMSGDYVGPDDVPNPYSTGEKP